MKRTFVKHLLLLLLLFSGKTTFAQWTVVNPTNPVNICRQTTFVIGDTAYMGNGDVGFFVYSQVWHGYTSASNTWWPVRKYPGGGGDMGFSFVINNQAYLGGGANPSYQSDFYQYDPVAGWTSKGSAPGGMARAFSLGFAIGNKGYVCTGSNYGTPLNDLWEYDPSVGVNGTWTQKKQFPGVARYAGAAFVINGKGYVGFGCNNSPSVTFNDMYEYDPVADSWRQMASMPATYGMEEPTFVILCNKLFVSAGDTSHTATNGTAQSWIFDPANGPIGTWYQLPDFQGTISYSTQGVVLNDTAYLMGGYINSNHSYLNQMYRYLPSLISVSPDTTICAGASVSLTADGSGAFKWSPYSSLSDSITTSNLATGGKTTVMAMPTVTTTYTVTEAVCDHQTATIVVNVGSGQTDTVKATPSTICSGRTSTLTVTGNANFTWSPSSALSGGVTTGNMVTADPLVTTTYSVTSGGGGCSFNGTVVVEVGNAALGGHVTAIRDTICQGTPGNLTLTGSSGGNLQWQSSADGNNFNDAGDTTTKYKTTPLLQSAWYRVTVGSGSCSAISDTLQLYVPPALTAYFDYSQQTAKQVTFDSDSSSGNIRSYHWDFGDGNTSAEKNPSHTYSKDTIYYVCLTLYDGSNCSYTFCRYSSVTDAVPSIPAEGNWTIYPNPFNEKLTVSSKQANGSIQRIEIYDVLGQLVINKNIDKSTASLQLDVSSLAKGMYYAMIKTADANYVQKVVKQ